MARTISEAVKAALVTMLQKAVKDSDAKLADRADAWEAAEKANQSYLPKADSERKQKTDAEEQSYTKLIIPYSYAMQLAAHTYLCSVFLSRPVVFQYEGRSGQGQDEQMAAESLIQHNVTAGGIDANLFFALFDVLQYGIGCVGTYWDREVHSITTYGKKKVMVEGIEDPENEEEVEEVIDVEGYEGNKCFTVKPKELIVDPSVGFARFQDGQFFGRRVQLPIKDLMRGQRQGIYFDVDKVAEDKTKEGIYGDNPAYVETEATNPLVMKRRSGYANIWEVYAKVVPAELGLGSNENEEIWVFTVANSRILIGAAPAGWLHGKYPFDLLLAEFDGYTLSSRGFPEIGAPLNGVMNWLLNSHMYNVSKSINNEYLYDPSMINMQDFLDPKPGKRIRIKPAAYGKDVRTFIHQFQQGDYTGRHIQDISLVEQLFQRVFGINEQMLGALSQGGRKTATEVRSSSGFGLNRLKILAEFMSKTFFAPLGNKLLKNAFQMYDKDKMFRLTLSDGKGKFSEGFTIDEIMGEYHFSPVDGTLPIDRFAQTQIYTELLTAIQQLPQVAGRYDTATLFAYIANLAGIKNLSSFEIKDEGQVRREAELGNLVVNGGQNAIGNTGIPGAAEEVIG